MSLENTLSFQCLKAFQVPQEYMIIAIYFQGGLAAVAKAITANMEGPGEKVGH
jgi:hypothetical protein